MGSFTPPPTTALSPGDRLDRYELLCILAQGGMGTVWLARITGKHGFERLIALKTILATYGNDRTFCDMFLDEARIAAQIDHENVARILEIGEDKGVLYHAMELIDGESLRKLYRDIRSANAPFPLAVALRIAADTCAGLHAVHELRGPDGMSLEVVHRDVSPQNILITVRGTIKLIDFGVAKARQRRTEETTAGTLKGKIEYMAPEQARGERMDRRADVYAIGAVLYELLSGEPVRCTEEGRQLLALHELMTGAPYEPLHHSIPLPVRSIVDRALAQNPEERYRTTEDLRHALEQAMITIGHSATSDDVANVLGHFSRERTARRKEAIDAAVRAASSFEKRASVHTVVAPQTGTPISNPNLDASQHGVYARGRPPTGPGGSGSIASIGPKGTRVIGVTALAAAAGTGAAPHSQSHLMPGEGPNTHISGHGTGPGTGPSMRTMQGAVVSEYPQAPKQGTSAGKIFAALGVLSLVAVLGVTLGVVMSRSSVTSANASTQPTSTVAAAAGGGSMAGAASTTSPTQAPVPPPPPPGGDTGTVIGASDAGIPATAKTTGGPKNTGTGGPTKGPKNGGPRAGGQKPDGDEYGF